MKKICVRKLLVTGMVCALAIGAMGCSESEVVEETEVIEEVIEEVVEELEEMPEGEA